MIDIKNLKFNLNLDKIKEFLSDEQKRSYAIIGAALFMLVIYIAFLIIPTFGSLARVSRTAGDLKKKIDLVNSRLEHIDEMRVKLETLKKEQSGYGTQLPDEKEIPRFLEGLADVAKESNVNIQSVTPHELTAKPEDQGTGKYYGAMPVVITAKSGYHQLGHFINDLEEGGRFITVEDVKIQYDNNFPRKHNVQMVLRIYVSYDNEKKDK